MIGLKESCFQWFLEQAATLPPFWNDLDSLAAHFDHTLVITCGRPTLLAAFAQERKEAGLM